MSESRKERGATNVRRFKPYPEYKDSGVEWMGEIPADWEVKPLKHLTAFSTGWTPPTGREDLYGGEHLWANIGDLSPKVLCTTEKTISDAAIREARLRIVAAGSLLFSFKLSVGTVSIAGVDMYTNEAIAAFAPSERIDTRYLYWAAPVLVPRNAQENIYGAPLLNRERIANARLLSPPMAEQRAIAAFLDRETARIDRLVAKKERLIELLQEKRTALITRAVTKGLPAAAAAQAGLDPSVPMKDSAVERLGEIPAHWEVVRLGRKIVLQRGEDITKDEQNVGDVPVVSSGGISSFHDKAFVAGPGVIVGRKGTAGAVYYVEPDFWPHDTTLWVKEFRGNHPRYVFYKLCTMDLASFDTGSANPTLNRNLIHPVTVSWPPVGEQAAIAAFLDRETVKIDTLAAKIRDVNDHLKELRTALMSAAVTGKIDVRGEVA